MAPRVRATIDHLLAAFASDAALHVPRMRWRSMPVVLEHLEQPVNSHAQRVGNEVHHYDAGGNSHCFIMGSSLFSKKRSRPLSTWAGRPDQACALRVAMSITKRYFTSLLSMRS